MIPRCPKCKTSELVTPPGHQTQALRCPTCRGTWLPRDEARLEVAGALLENDATLHPHLEADARTGLCPLGHGILIRARVELDDPFHVERCAECHGLWFDKGEWSKLAASRLLHNLDDLWDPAWRHRMRLERQHEAHRLTMEAELSPPVLELLETLANALKERSPRVQSLALAYLREQIAEDEPLPSPEPSE
jgi:Zn-finger nucleic acid-binding protein